ncbi:MAG: peptidase C39 family protein, partial [Nocardioides sp.]
VLTLLLTPCYVAAVTPADPAEAANASLVAAKRADVRQVHYRQFDSGAELRTGTGNGTRVARGRLRIAEATAERTLKGTRYEQSTWDSPWVDPGFALTELIPSWSATTPGDSFVEVRVRGRNAAGTTSSWDLMGRWAKGDRFLSRSTFGAQSDDLAQVNVDTWRAPGGLTSYQLRVTLARKAGSTRNPGVDTIGAVASRLPAGAGPTSQPGPGRGIVLDVPRYSQMIHGGEFPEYNGGGEAWCSPTSTSMVLGYYDALPGARSYSWVPAGYPDPWVAYAARMTFDHTYDGTGNWPFNTAYAAPRVGKAFVTRLRSLREAERFIAAGIPLIASISFGSGELTGAPISATAGHLLVVVGFTEDGDVVVNDPAGRDSSAVRRTYDRAQLEQAWLSGSGGTVYVIRDAAHPLPKGNQSNW